MNKMREKYYNGDYFEILEKDKSLPTYMIKVNGFEWGFVS